MPGANDINGIYIYAEDDPIASPNFSSLLNRLASSVSTRIAALSAPVLGVLGFSAGWTNTAGSSSVVVVGKIVTLTLRATRASAITAAAIPVTLPAGFRPLATVAAAGYCSGAGNPLFAAVEIDSAGVVRVYPTAATAEVNLSTSISFRVP